MIQPQQIFINLLTRLFTRESFGTWLELYTTLEYPLEFEG